MRYGSKHGTNSSSFSKRLCSYYEQSFISVVSTIGGILSQAVRPNVSQGHKMKNSNAANPFARTLAENGGAKLQLRQKIALAFP